MRKGHRRYIGKLSELVKEDRWEERHGGGVSIRRGVLGKEDIKIH